MCDHSSKMGTENDANFVGNLLQKAFEDDDANFKSTKVEKNLELEFDVGNLTAFDSNILDLLKYK